jgi:hypothetical protein
MMAIILIAIAGNAWPVGHSPQDKAATHRCTLHIPPASAEEAGIGKPQIGELAKAADVARRGSYRQFLLARAHRETDTSAPPIAEKGAGVGFGEVSGENLGTVVGNGHGVLPVHRTGAVVSDDGPVIGQRAGLRAAGGEHRLDGQHTARR